VGTGDRFGVVADECPAANGGPSAAYSNGLADGESARALRAGISIYLEVGIDDYAIGFRAGFFASKDRESGPELRVSAAQSR